MEPRAQLFHLQNGKNVLGLSKVRADGEGNNFKSKVQGHCCSFQQKGVGACNLKKSSLCLKIWSNACTSQIQEFGLF